MKFVLVLAALTSVALGQNINELSGSWKEDFKARVGLSPFLYSGGLDWFRRTVATTTSWQNHMKIGVEGNNFHIKGERGPFNTNYAYTLVSDGQTNTKVAGPLGESDMDTRTTAAGTVLTTEVIKPESGNIVYKSIRRLTGPNKLEHEVVHVPSGKSVVFHYTRE